MLNGISFEGDSMRSLRASAYCSWPNASLVLSLSSTNGTVKLTDFPEVPLIDMPPESLVCRVDSNRIRAEKEWIPVNLKVALIVLSAARPSSARAFPVSMSRS